MSTKGDVEFDNRIGDRKGFRGKNCITTSKSELARSSNHGQLALWVIELVRSMEFQGVASVFILKDYSENH